jgi:hypothetical protein
MSRTTLRGSSVTRSFNLLVCLVICLSPASLAQSADEVALRQLVERFFNAYARKDLPTLELHFSKQSPYFASAMRNFHRLFTANNLQLRSLTIEKISVEGERGTVRTIADLTVVNITTGETADGFEKPVLVEGAQSPRTLEGPDRTAPAR